MEINKPMTTRNMLASTLTDYKKPVKLPKITVELDPMLKKRFKAEAVRRGTTIRDMLTAWIECDCPPLDAADARAEAKQDGRSRPADRTWSNATSCRAVRCTNG